MHQIFNYNLYIFDCDGVILDSNALKVQAMKEALEALSFKSELVTECVTYFANNFGKSRFHHVTHFVNEILELRSEQKAEIEAKILSDFSNQCKELYLTASLTPGFLNLIQTLPGKKFVASGSEQSELRAVFKTRGLDKYFVDVFGSPTLKTQLLSNILQSQPDARALMIGDAVSDFDASQENNIDFICYVPYSNVPMRMQLLSKEHQFEVIEHWPQQVLMDN
ncbi:HAD family hydrolase [Shewanella canadensis]|uniref:phosphoglycolate phosphatase n=1 Tax=Shewanella canadensis TaxID=271096 RepID=A0A3S0LI04_9GAMM|nr:HAD hydrolase-like protein [Shewanella canadensis]RTR35969.1 HAD family hydrolase [Shewanella canadensis]